MSTLYPVSSLATRAVPRSGLPDKLVSLLSSCFDRMNGRSASRNKLAR